MYELKRGFDRSDLVGFEMIENSANVFNRFKDRMIPALERMDKVWVLYCDGRVISIFGLVDFWPGRCESFTFMGKNLGSKFIVAFKTIKKKLYEFLPRYNRIECVIETDDKENQRWARALGFKLETERMHKFSTNGTDCSMFVLIGGK